MATLRAIDLATSSIDAPRWQELRWAAAALQPGSVVTPAGFAFGERLGASETDGFRVEIVPPDDLRLRLRSGEPLPPPHPDERRLPVVDLRAGGARGGPAVPDGGLVIDVERRLARVGVHQEAWETVSEPVLLAISQCWRFREIDRRLDQLTAWTRDADRGRLPKAFRSVQRSVRLDDTMRAFRQLLLDLPAIEGPLTDVQGYFPGKRPARLYRALARALGLSQWRSLIDERVEVVEAALSELAEERRQRIAVAATLALELLILIALVADLAINLFAVLHTT